MNNKIKNIVIDNANVIKFFGVALVEEQNKMTFAEVNALAIPRGYLVHPDVCNATVYNYLADESINYNATFYKDWADIVSKSRFELAVDQILHYLTTYGSFFTQEGNGYVPNDGIINTPAYKNLKPIMPITKDEVYNKCLTMLESGVALKQETMTFCANFILKNLTAERSFDIDLIKNREAQIYIADIANVYPSNPDMLFKYIVYKTTGDTMVIKNKLMINKIKQSSTPFDFSKLNSKQLIGLSSIFLRNKDLFLAFKQYNPYIINKLRRLAKTTHKPMKQAFWSTVFSEPKSLNDLLANVNSLTNYKKVALMQTCLERMVENKDQIYIVRNQKMFMRKNYISKVENTVSYMANVYSILGESLVKSLAEKSQVVSTSVDENGVTLETVRPMIIKRAKNIKVCLPTSEKSFIGNYPFGTSMKLSKNNYYGVYWKNEWGTNDYDLSFLDNKLQKIGWNSSYYNNAQSVIYSGDMTYADPEASEVILFKQGAPTGVIKVNQFNGESKSKFKLFFGQDDNFNEFNNNGYMIDPNTISIETEVQHENLREMMLGVSNGEELVLMNVGSGNSAVSSCGRYIPDMLKVFYKKSKCFINAEEFLTLAGYTFVDPDYEGEVDIDLSNLEKDSLIKLMA